MTKKAERPEVARPEVARPEVAIERWKGEAVRAMVTVVICFFSVVLAIATLMKPTLDQVGKRIDTLDKDMDEAIAALDDSLTKQIDRSYKYLNGRIDTVHDSLNQRIDDRAELLITRIDQVNFSVNERITSLHNPVLPLPVPEPAKLPPDKSVEITKQELLAAEAEEEIITVPAGDYVALSVSFSLGETVLLQWGTPGAPEGNGNIVDFYLVSEEGHLYRYIRDSQYDSPWVSPDDALVYFYFVNTFDPSKSKDLWIRLEEGD